MKVRNINKSLLLIAAIELVALIAMAADDAATYLIMNDIPPYYRLTQTFDAYTDKLKTIPGYTIKRYPGVIAGVDHFMPGHSDVTYETSYQSNELNMGMSVQVTFHPGSDSDKWLLHEVERAFQKPESLGSAYAGKTSIRNINGSRMFYMWRHYRWISNNVVVSIDASDEEGKKPEPLEVVNAYLQKFPSTIPAQLLLDSAHNLLWIKDEMERRMWLCDKWSALLASGKTDPKTVFEAVIKSMNVFLDYREKYYGIKAIDEKNILAGYLNQSNGVAIQVKLTDYKAWWSAHKADTISLP